MAIQELGLEDVRSVSGGTGLVTGVLDVVEGVLSSKALAGVLDGVVGTVVSLANANPLVAGAITGVVTALDKILGKLPI